MFSTTVRSSPYVLRIKKLRFRRSLARVAPRQESLSTITIMIMGHADWGGRRRSHCSNFMLGETHRLQGSSKLWIHFRGLRGWELDENVVCCVPNLLEKLTS